MDTHVTSNALAVIPSGAISPPNAVGDVRSMEQLAKALWRRRIFIGLCGIVLGIASFAVTKQLPKRYTAGGIVTVDTHRFTVPELQGVVGADNPVDPSPQVRSETLVLRSPALLRKVVDRLDLAADPEFNPLLRPPGITDQAKALVIGVFTGEFLPEPVVTWLASWGIMLPEKTVDRPLGPEAVRELVIQSLADNLTVFNDGRSLVISVTFTSESAERSAQIVNQLFESYLGEKREVRASRNREGQAALQARLEEARNELLAAEKRVRAFREQHGIVAVRAGSVFQQHVEDLGTALARAGEERARINGNWQRAQAMASRGAIPADLADVLASSTVSRLREREAEAVRRLTELSSRLGPSHPEHRSASSELAAARAETAAESRRVVASLGEQAQSAREREADLARQLERARSQATRLSAVQGELLQLEKDSDTRRVLYQNLMQRVEQSASEPRDPQVLGVQIVSFAVAPNEPSAPKPTLSGGIGMLLGLGVAGLVTVLGRQQRGVFRDLEDLAQETRLPVLAAVPRSSGWRAQTTVLERTTAEPRGLEAEVLRGLRAQLRFVSPQAAPRSVAFAPSAAGESAAMLAAAFARVAAMDGLRVLLIEGDLQRPSLADALDAPDSNGLITAYSQSAPWNDAVTRDVASPLDLLLVNEPPPDARQVLESVRFQQLLADACEEYNLVVVNAPAVTATAEAMVLAHFVDATVLVVEAGATPRDRVKAAVERLLVASNGLTAAVLNRAVAKG
ncbi:MAG TPA: polysaccharide biosynthesis tyrosine autokinase [Acetobacteraceae bacterium]|nr:polysaccharide biosynthesis tyrosine autokinase [Acetobacteraceae bacterium]